jgi:heptosyltransferase-2
MKILVVSNFFPPFHKTGFALGCRDLVQSLIKRQHQIKVLTGAHGMENTQIENHIHRKLVINDEELPDWKDVFLKEFTNQTYFRKICVDFEPEIVFFFDLSHVSLSLLPLADDMGLPSCSYYSNNGFITPEKDQWHKLWPKGNQRFKVLRFLTHRFKLTLPQPFKPSTHSVFTSNHLKNVAMDLKRATPDAEVVPLGLDINRFPYKKVKKEKPSRLLYVGNIHPDNGIDDVIKAMHLLKNGYGQDSLSLTIAGDETKSPDYTTYLRDLAENLGIPNSLEFVGFIPQENMPDVYHSNDILVSPSLLDDSSNRTVLEAMSSGIAIVSSSTESKMEILEDRSTAMIYTKENPASCADKIRRFLEDHEYMESIRTNARRSVESKFQISRSVDLLENIFLRAKEKTKPAISPPAKNHDELSFDDLLRNAKWWLKLGKLLVFARILTKPGFYLHLPKKIYKKTFVLTPHLFNSVLFKIYYFLHGQRQKKSNFPLDEMQKILVVQLADIGDVILTSPFIRELRGFFPNAWIGLVVQPRIFELIEKCPYVNEVIVFDWRAIKNVDAFLRGSSAWWTLPSRASRQNLWKHHLDMAISIRWNEDSCQAASLILMYTSGATTRVAYKATSTDPMRYGWKDLNRLITRGPSRGSPKHEVEHQLDILRYLGTNPKNTQLEVWTTKEDDRFAKDIFKSHSIAPTDVPIVFAPGAAWSFRRWPPERFIELGRWLQEIYKAHILIVAGKNEHDLAVQIEKGLHKNKTINLAGKTTLREMASIFKRCRLFIGNDSGPLHIAAAAGIPVVGFYGPGEYQRFKPWGIDYDVLRLGLFCSPCSQNCIFDEPRCIEGLGMNYAKKILARKLASILDHP